MQLNLYNKHGEFLGCSSVFSPEKTTEEEALEIHIQRGNEILLDKDSFWKDAVSFDVANENNEILYPQ